MLRYQLTDRQRDFATEHHNVLEEFLIRRGLDFDDYYDVVVFKFLMAVKRLMGWRFNIILCNLFIKTIFNNKQHKNK